MQRGLAETETVTGGAGGLEDVDGAVEGAEGIGGLQVGGVGVEVIGDAEGWRKLVVLQRCWWSRRRSPEVEEVSGVFRRVGVFSGRGEGFPEVVLGRRRLAPFEKWRGNLWSNK